MGTEELINTIIAAAAVIVAALIAGVVTLIVQSVQLKRDGKSIDSISSDTTNIKPKVDNIDTAVKCISKDIAKIEDRSQQISSIATTVESFKFMKDQVTNHAIRPDEMIAQMTNVFEECASLLVQHKNDQEQIADLTKANKALGQENKQLKNRIQELTTKLEYEQRRNTRSPSHKYTLDR